jgi:hypothetical protein
VRVSEKMRGKMKGRMNAIMKAVAGFDVEGKTTNRKNFDMTTATKNKKSVVY